MGCPSVAEAIVEAAGPVRRVIEVYFRQERHSFSLSEVPAVLGIFYLSPLEYLVALAVGSGLALALATDQSPLKILFNLANNLFIGVLALVIFNAFANAGPIPGAADWIAILVAMIVASAVGAVTIAAAITLSAGRRNSRSCRRWCASGGSSRRRTRAWRS